jgi:hypothetical protein
MWNRALGTCGADMRRGGSPIDGDDIQGFVDCQIGGGTDCGCADLQTDGVLDIYNDDAFVTALLAGTGCP